MQVEALSRQEEFEAYAEFGHEVYRDNPYWVPPDRHFQVGLISGEAVDGAQTRVRAFRAAEGERTLAVITAVVDEAYNRHWGERLGHLFFFEARRGEEAAAGVLLREACDWLRAQGAQAARFSMLPGWQLPLTIDAYEEVPTFIHTYNPPCYHSYVKNAGFETERGVVQYQVEFTPELARRYEEMVARATEAGVSLRPFDPGRASEEAALLTALQNETFAAHWGMMPLSVLAMTGLIEGLGEALVTDFIRVAEVGGEAAGFVFSLPDLNQALHGLRGGADPAALPKAVAAIDHGILLIIGVRAPYRGRGVNLALGARSYLAMIERGYRRASYTVVLDDNWPSRRTAEKLGARVTRNFNVYRKGLA